MRIITSMFVLVFALATHAFAESQLIEKVEAKPGSYDIAYEKWQLDNGLTLIIHEDHSDPIVHVDVTYHVGSAREIIGQTGFAHFFEHMMFQGSVNVKDDEHFQMVSNAGGTMNGTTNRDRTNYFQTLPSNQLETALWLESDRMGLLLDSVTQKKFESQRSAVKNEKSQNIENQPYAMGFVEYMPQILYPHGHPYSWPTIGYVDDLDAVEVDALKDFFLRWYGPNNAVVTIAGDVDPKEVLTLTEKYFGPIKKGPEVRKQRIPLPILPQDQYKNYTDNVYLPMMIMTFPTVNTWHRDEAALDVLADLMGGGNNSIFYQEFVKTEEAIQAGVGHPTSELAGEFSINVVAYPSMEFSFNELETKVRKTIEDFEATLNDDAVERAKSSILGGMLDRYGSVSGKASTLAAWSTYLNKSYNVTQELDRYKNVTKADVLRVYNKYVKGKNAAIVNIYSRNPMQQEEDSIESVNPFGKAEREKSIAAWKEGQAAWKYERPAYDFDKAVKPTPAQAKLPVIPEFWQKKMDNGLEIIGTRSTEIPRVVILIDIEGGDMIVEDPEQVGIASFTAGMMNEGTEKRTSEEFSAELDKLGSSIGVNGGRYSSSIFVNCFKDKVDETMALLEERLFSTKFTQDDFKRLQKQTVEALNQRTSSGNQMVSEAFSKIMYEGSMLSHFPTVKTMRKLKMSDIQSYYDKSYSPNVAKVIVVGDISQEDALAKLSFLEKWENKNTPDINVSAISPQEETTIYLVHKPRSPQSLIRLGHLGPKYDATGDYFKARAMNFILGGAFNSRINLNLREDKGYTYGARSGFGGNKYVGTFVASASVKRSVTDSAITEIMKEITSYQTKGITEDELQFTKNSLLNSEALDYETNFQKAGFLSQIVEYGLTREFTKEQATVLKAMTTAEMKDLSNKHIDMSKMAIVVVGNKYQIKKKLEKLGLGKVKEIKLD